MDEVVIFDGDDTLWEMQRRYTNATNKFCNEMSSLGYEIEDVKEKLIQVDCDNVDLHQFSKERFPISMGETYVYFCESVGNPIDEEVQNTLEKIGGQVFQFEENLSIIDGAFDLLRELSGNYRLIFYSGGDEDIQEKKLQVTGLVEFFNPEDVIITNIKTESSLDQVLKSRDISVDKTWIIGNSLRSDIEPALNLGLNCIYYNNPDGEWDYDKKVFDRSKYVDSLWEIFSLLDVLKIIKNPRAEDKVIYVFSSAKFDLFRQIILNDLSAPDGYITLYRYEFSIVDSTLWNIAEQNPDSLKERDAIIVYIDGWEGLDKQESRLVFIPLRIAKVSKAIVEGGTLYLYLKLGKYIKYERGIENASELVDHYHHKLDLFLPRSYRPESMKFCVPFSRCTDIPSSSGGENNQLQAWEGIVSALVQTDAWSQCIFYKLKDLRNISGKTLSLEEVRPERSGYNLKTGLTYSLDMCFYDPREDLPQDIINYKIQPKINEDHFFTTTQPISVNFPYDLRPIDLIVKSRQIDAWTKIWFELINDEPTSKRNQSEEFLRDRSKELITSRSNYKTLAPEIEFNIKLCAPKTKIGIWLLIFIIGGLLTALAGSAEATSFFDHYISRVDILNLSFTILGPLLSTLAIYNLYHTIK